MIAPQKILLNAGRSEAGFSGVSALKLCPQLYAYERPLGLNLKSTDPLVKGSLLHVGVAHILRRAQALQEGDDPERWYRPSEAIPLAAQAMDRENPAHRAARWVPLVTATCRAYHAAPGSYPQQILSVEEVIRVALRWRPGAQRIAEVRLLGTDERLPEGWRLYTQRLDAVSIEDGCLAVDDHKSASYIRASTRAAYTMHGQFWGAELLVRLRWPELAERGVRVYANLIEWPKYKRGQEPDPEDARVGRIERIRLRGAQAMLSGFWRDILDWYDFRDRLLSDGRSPWDWPKAGIELGCMTRYGECAYTELCRKGPSALGQLQLEQRFQVTAKR